MYGTAFVDNFRYATTPLYKKVWKERIEPYVEDYPKVRRKFAGSTTHKSYLLLRIFEFVYSMYKVHFWSFFAQNPTTLPLLSMQSKEGMTEWIHADKSYAMLDNYNSRIYYDDYVNCQTVDVPKNYFTGQYAMPVAKGLPYFQAMWYHMNALKVT